MIKIAVFDVDGTLLSHQNWTIPQSAVDAVNTLQAKGVKIVIASGRPIYGLNNVTNAGIKPDYVVGCNGHTVYNEKQELIASKTFSFEQVETLTDYLCNQHDYILTFKFSKGNYIYNRAEDMKDLHKKLQLPESDLNIDKERKHHYQELPFGAVTYFPQKDATYYEQNIDPSIVFLPFNTDSYDVSIKGISKGWGLKKLLEYLHLDPSECIAFGDGQNDVEMIELAGIGVAMKECAKELLDVCDYQTCDILEDGVAKALKHFELI